MLPQAPTSPRGVRRFPGREQRRAADPDGLRAAWAAVERTWAATLDRVAAMPPGTVDVRVDGEWSFAQTLRHLVMATDTWLRGAVLGIAQPYHPIGQPDEEYAADGHDPRRLRRGRPAVRRGARGAGRARGDGAGAPRVDHPRGPRRRAPRPVGARAPVLSCLRTVLEEEWEHHRYAVRDLDAIAAGHVG